MCPDDAANTKFLLLSPHLHKLNEKITITLFIKCFLFLAYCLLCVLSLLWQINCTRCVQGGGGSAQQEQNCIFTCVLLVISGFFSLIILIMSHHSYRSTSCFLN